MVYMSEVVFNNKMESWEENLRDLPQRLKAINEKPPLRHGKPYAIVSDISEQFYCEMKVEMELRYGRAETEMKRKGEEIHEELLRMEKAELEDFINGIKLSRLYPASLPLAAEVEGIPIIGKPDCVAFSRGCPAFVSELKTFGGGIFRLHNDHVVQAMIYALLLEEMGFDCSRTTLHIVGARRELDQNIQKEIRMPLIYLQYILHLKFTDYLRTTQRAVYISKEMLAILDGILSKQSDLKRVAELMSSNALSIFLVPYSREKALNDLRWAKAYWTNERKEPKPTQKPGKCAVCEFADRCPASSSSSSSKP